MSDALSAERLLKRNVVLEDGHEVRGSKLVGEWRAIPVADYTAANTAYDALLREKQAADKAVYGGQQLVDQLRAQLAAVEARVRELEKLVRDNDAGFWHNEAMRLHGDVERMRAALERFKEKRGTHEGDHVFVMCNDGSGYCKLCDQSYLPLEAELDAFIE